MTEAPQTPAVKIKRSRRRLYEPVENSSLDQAGESESPESMASEDGRSADLEAVAMPPEKIAPVSDDLDEKDAPVRKIIKKYAYWSASTALIPIPALDFMAVTALEIKMIHELCREYRVTFSKARVKAIIGSLVGGWHAGMITGSLIKSMPLIGPAIASVSAGAIAGAITYALGIVFIKHFEMGGTLLNFNPAAYREKFNEALKEGERLVP